MSAHSALGPSSAHRWMACPGSVQAEALWWAENPNHDDSSPYAEEGTRAHELAEVLLNNPELPEPGDQYENWDDPEMLKHALRYRDYCQRIAGDGALCFVETRVTMPRVHRDAFGTADFIAYIPEYQHLHVIDLKYGSGIQVDAEENPQALLYAEGARQMLYDKHRIKPRFFTVHIYQPRLRTGEHITSWQLRNTELDDWISKAHVAALETRIAPEVFNPGDKQCKWCKANPCKARAAQVAQHFDAQFEDLDDAVEQATDTTPLLSDTDLSAWLTKCAMLKQFISRIEDQAYQRSMDGHTLPGYKLVEGRGSYQGDAETLEFLLGDDAFKPRQLRSKTELQKTLGSAKFQRVAAPYYKQLSGKPTLVPVTDLRPEVGTDAMVDRMLEDLP